MKKSLKLLSVLLALVMVFSLTTVFAATETAAEPVPAGETAVPESVETSEETAGGAPVDLKKQIVPEDEVPDLIDYSVAVEKKYVCRAYWEEKSLNEVVFLKADGSFDRYTFAFPVKYTEGNETYDKDPALVARETLLSGKYRYELAAQNDTTLYCAENLTDGFYFAGGDLQVNLRPITEEEYDFLRGHISAGSMTGISEMPQKYNSTAVTGSARSALSQQAESVTAAVYALSTSGETASLAAAADTLSVVPCYTGFQMELNLSQSGLQNKIFFELSTDKLILLRQKDTLLLYDAKGNPVGIVGDLLSENGVNHDVLYTVTALENGKYLLAADLPRGSATSYTMSVTAYYSGIEDASIYSNDDTKYGQSANLWVGYHSSSHIERVIIRPQIWYYIDDNYAGRTVQSAYLVLRDVTVTTQEQTIECREFPGLYAWEEDDMNWEAAGDGYYGTNYDSKPVSSAIGASSSTGYYYYFDVSDAISNWYLDNHASGRGLILRWNQDETYTSGSMEKCFASTQYSTERYRPRFEITTAPTATLEDGVYYVRSLVTGNPYMMTDASSLNDTNVYQQTALESGNSVSGMNQMWRVTHAGNGYYTLRPYHYTPAGLSCYSPAGETVYDENVVIYSIGYSDLLEDVPSFGLWRFVRNSDGTYCLNLFGSNAYLGSVSTVAGNIRANDNYWTAEHMWTFPSAGNVSPWIRYYEQSTGAPVTSLERTTYKVGYNTFADLGLNISVCSPGTIDPRSLVWASTDEEYIEVFQNLQTVFFNCKRYGSASIYCSSILNGESILVFTHGGGDYYIRNVETGRFIDILNQQMASGTVIHQWSFHSGDTQRWRIERYDSNYCTIRTTAGSMEYYIGVQNGSPEDGTAIVLTSVSSGVTDAVLWKASETSSGNYKFIAKVAESYNRALSVSPGWTQYENGVPLMITAYTDDDEYADEWGFNTKYFTLVNYYDSSFTEEGLLSNVASAGDFAATVYARYAGVAIRIGEPSFSPVDITGECPNDDSLCGSSCGSVENCLEQHHKSIYRISNQLYEAPREENHIYILWTNYGNNTFCVYNEEERTHKAFTDLACVVNSRPIIQVASILGSTTEEKGACMKILLAHELAHTFGYPDVYNNSWHDQSGTVCFMEMYEQKPAGDFCNSVQNGGDPLCSYCLARIPSLVQNCQHPGNMS